MLAHEVLECNVEFCSEWTFIFCTYIFHFLYIFFTLLGLKWDFFLSSPCSELSVMLVDTIPSNMRCWAVKGLVEQIAHVTHWIWSEVLAPDFLLFSATVYE